MKTGSVHEQLGSSSSSRLKLKAEQARLVSIADVTTTINMHDQIFGYQSQKAPNDIILSRYSNISIYSITFIGSPPC